MNANKLMLMSAYWTSPKQSQAYLYIWLFPIKPGFPFFILKPADITLQYLLFSGCEDASGPDKHHEERSH